MGSVAAGGQTAPANPLDLARAAIARGTMAIAQAGEEDFPFYVRAVQKELTDDQLNRIAVIARKNISGNPNLPPDMLYVDAVEKVLGRSTGTNGIAARAELIRLRARGRAALTGDLPGVFKTSKAWDKAVGSTYVGIAMVPGAFGVLILGFGIVGVLTLPYATGRAEAEVAAFFVGTAFLALSVFLVRFQLSGTGRIYAMRYVIDAVSKGQDPVPLISVDGDLLVDGKGRPVRR